MKRSKGPDSKVPPYYTTFLLQLTVMKPKRRLRTTRFPFLLFVGFMVTIALFSQMFSALGSPKTEKRGQPSKGFSDLITPTPTPTPKPLMPPLVAGEAAVNVPVLLYHYIGLNPNKDDKARDGLSTSPQVFDEQLALLKANGFTAITLDTMATAFDGKTLPPKPIILTFDDGYIDFYTNAYPILVKYQMTGTVFIPTGLIGSNDGMYMNWSQIEELSRKPYVVFGAHSVNHYYLPKSSPAVLLNELTESKRVLEQHVGYNVNWFAYPYGAFNDEVVAAAKHAGYIGALTTIPGQWQYKSRLFYILRIKPGSRVGGNLLGLLN